MADFIYMHRKGRHGDLVRRAHAYVDLATSFKLAVRRVRLTELVSSFEVTYRPQSRYTGYSPEVELKIRRVSLVGHDPTCQLETSRCIVAETAGRLMGCAILVPAIIERSPEGVRSLRTAPRDRAVSLRVGVGNGCRIPPFPRLASPTFIVCKSGPRAWL